MVISARQRLILTTSIVALTVSSSLLRAALPPVPTPPPNPITEQKRILGKILFWDEQLSSDNTVACGTCHIPSDAGSDPRIGRHPGADGLFNTPDDKLGSFGVARMDSAAEYIEDSIFGFDVQVTERTAQHVVNSAFAAGAMFWDGRATGQFVNPETGVVSIPLGAALESQAVGPILSDIEMGHQGRTWPQVRDKLNASIPLALASLIPPDMAAAIAGGKTYGDLFASAFGDPNITAERIAFAIATYERTLVSDQTPWDQFDAGNVAALTPAQQLGLNTFTTNGRCVVCHGGPTFTNNGFRNIGVRPPNEDTGRFEVTGNANDLGRFKVPTLRNVALKNRFMHNGQFSTLNQVVTFYRNPAQQFPQNKDPNMDLINIPPNQVANLVDFLENGLTDQRVANEVFPFDRPRLFSELIYGDVNCDGFINGRDIAALTLALVDDADYGTIYSDCNINTADMNGDSNIDVSDIGELLALLLAP